MDGFDRETGEVISERPQLPVAESRPQNLIFASANPGEVFGALCTMQGTMTAPKRTKDAKVEGKSKYGKDYSYTYKYAPLEEIIAAVQRPMAEAGLAYRQFLASREGQWVMRTVIAHRTGEWFGCDYPIFWDEGRGMQGFASGVTYARRYGLMLALGIAAEDDDDANVADGNVATVQDRRQTASRGRTAKDGRPSGEFSPEGNQALHGPLNGGSVDPAANGKDATSTDPSLGPSDTGEPPREFYEAAVAQVANAKQAIAACQTADEVDTLFKSEQWKGCQNIIRRGRPKQADAMIQQLIERGEDRKLALADGPMTVGEMG